MPHAAKTTWEAEEKPLGSGANVKTLVLGWVGWNTTIWGGQTRPPPRVPLALIPCVNMVKFP